MHLVNLKVHWIASSYLQQILIRLESVYETKIIILKWSEFNMFTVSDFTMVSMLKCVSLTFSLRISASSSSLCFKRLTLSSSVEASFSCRPFRRSSSPLLQQQDIHCVVLQNQKHYTNIIIKNVDMYPTKLVEKAQNI